MAVAMAITMLTMLITVIVILDSTASSLQDRKEIKGREAARANGRCRRRRCAGGLGVRPGPHWRCPWPLTRLPFCCTPLSLQ